MLFKSIDSRNDLLWLHLVDASVSIVLKRVR